MMQQTSLWAYHNEIKPTLGSRQKLIYDELRREGEMTNGEIAMSLNIPINTVTPRVKELRDLGVVRLSRARECRVTGRTCMAWEVLA